jgi:hypothetical protein
MVRTIGGYFLQGASSTTTAQGGEKGTPCAPCTRARARPDPAGGSTPHASPASHKGPRLGVTTKLRGEKVPFWRLS